MYILADMDLSILIKKMKLGDLQKRLIIYQVVKGAHFLHSGGVVHRDLKVSANLCNN